jgi:hypothetical protein
MRRTIMAFGKEWERVWQEDDARPPDAENTSWAWKRFFDCDMPFGDEKWDELADEGTTLRSGNRLLSLAPDGDSIWIPSYSETMGWNEEIKATLARKCKECGHAAHGAATCVETSECGCRP